MVLGLVSASWTPEQDTILINAVNEYGKLWTRIARTYFPSRTGLSAKRRYYHLIAGEDGMRERCDEITSHDDDPLDSISAGKSRGVLELPECPDHLSSTFECVDDGPPNENKGSTPPSLPTRLISNDISSAFHPTAIHGDQANTHHTTTTHSTNSHNTTTTNSSNSHNTTHTNNMNSHNINITNHYHSHHKTKPKRSRWSVTTFVYNITNIIQPVPWLPSYCYNLGFSSWIPNYWSWFSSAWGNHHRFWNRYGWH
ncbi:hypothetical protein L218DRAFT_1003326 [Marasmius fiardii PR-910]|nr:hypothetical protein L218DRAFT_1003326 [Marasmius fiardii PR-910]